MKISQRIGKGAMAVTAMLTLPMLLVAGCGDSPNAKASPEAIATPPSAPLTPGPADKISPAGQQAPNYGSYYQKSGGQPPR